MNTKESKIDILPVTNEDTSGIRIKKIRQPYTPNRTPIKKIGHLRIGNFYLKFGFRICEVSFLEKLTSFSYFWL